jgi:RNA polymerase sigma-70 factor (ECF subfamily)
LINTSATGDTTNGVGFEKLFNESFNQHFDALHRYAYTLLKDSDRASDAVQHVFIKWWENQTAVADLQEARKYLFTAVYRSCLNVIRNEKVKQEHALAYSQEQMATTHFQDGMEVEELNQKIKQVIEDLPSQCRLIFCMSRLEEKKYSEIAADLNLSVKTVEAQMGKALKILREKLN